MADFSQEKKYDYNWENSKFKDVLFKGNKISNLVNDVGYLTSAGSILSASFASTASYVNPLRQNVYLTGSFNVTGSTTQIGNNSLLGNTVLSGSLTISGNTIMTGSITATNLTASFGYVSASFLDITGKQVVRGFTQYLPTNDSIPVTEVGGYIYSSGSQGDLYFSQTNGILTNVTRLRWIEGNLYTGLLNGGVISTASSTVFNVSSGSGIVVTLNGSLSSDPYPTVNYISWGNLSSSIAPLSASYDQSFIAIEPSGSNGIIYASGTPYNDGQYNTLIPIGNVIHQNRSTINATATYPSVAYGYKQRTNDFIRAFGPLKLSGLGTYVSGSSTGSLIIASGTAYSDGRNYLTDPDNPSYVTDPGTTTSKIFRYRQSGSGWAYDTNGGAGYLSIDPTQYSLNGVLTPVPGTGINRRWTIQRVYYFPSGATKGIYVYYGNETYATLIEATANIQFEDFIEAPNTAAGAILSSYLVVRNNADFTVPESYNIQQGGLFRNVGGSGGGGSAVSQTLTGLTDVLISGPTTGQPLVYDNATLKWENNSTLTATLIGTASYAQTASYVTNLNQSVTIGNITSTPSNENTLNIYPAHAGGTGEGGQILLAASGGLYTSASMIDNWQNYFRILRGTNTGGSNAQLIGLDLQTGNLSVAGAVIPGTWTAGQVIKDTMLSNTEVTISTTTIATSNSDTDFLTYSYTPVSSNSYLVIHYHLSNYDFSGGTGNDSYISRIKVDGGEITFSTQSTVNGNRSPVLFPLTGRYTNSSTAAKSIVVACRRNSADDSITITNSSTSMWLRITEIAR